MDMGRVGADLNCDEYHDSICAADSSGPFDYGMVSRLVSWPKGTGIPAVLDVLPPLTPPMWRWPEVRPGCPCALIGPGVQASHGMERHSILEAMLGTMALVERYLTASNGPHPYTLAHALEMLARAAPASISQVRLRARSPRETMPTTRRSSTTGSAAPGPLP